MINRFFLFQISIETILNQDEYSLKDLKSLEKLVIETKHETLNGNELQWPHLPMLNDLSLRGNCFDGLDEVKDDSHLSQFNHKFTLNFCRNFTQTWSITLLT